jgi:hypothetical protein
MLAALAFALAFAAGGVSAGNPALAAELNSTLQSFFAAFNSGSVPAVAAYWDPEGLLGGYA